MAASPRPIRFVMDAGFFKIPVLSALFRSLKAIPITSAKENEFVLEGRFADAKGAGGWATGVHFFRRGT